MVVGLGAGKTASRAIGEIGRRVSAGDLHGVTVVAASDAAEAMCLEVGLKVAETTAFERIDLLIDGADEVDHEMRMLKGSRGAVTRERIIAWASDRRVYIVPIAKLAERVGEHATLAVAVMPFGVGATREAIRGLGLNGVLRRDLGGGLMVTDNGNLILDVDLPADIDLADTAASLKRIPGVVEHGLFVDEADEILIEREDGAIDRMIREAE
jgi:ribose 5-phosphate isomerase A